jgi:hypothetical protein
VTHYSCGLAGLLATAAVAVLFYPVLVAVTRPLYLLSSTALLFVLVFAWFAIWLALALAWEWRAGRLPVSDGNRSP